MSAFLTIVKPSEPCGTMPQKLAMDFSFPLDPFQEHAIAAISRDENVLVTAKTGSGKTLVGEYQIAHSLKKGGRVFYTTPIKSLSNQKFHDLKKMFPSVGIMTGDLKFRPDADIVIMTTEILRNLLFKDNSAATRSLGITANLSLDRLDAVVFDECHYINDRDRGAIWEESIILLPPKVNLVLLSATIDSPELFAGWLGELKQKQIHLISTQYRVVPLQHAVYRGEHLCTIMDSKEVFDAATYKLWLRSRDMDIKAADDHKARVADRHRGGYEDGPVARKAGIKSFKHKMNELVGRLDEQKLLPALFFVFSRKDCERYAANMEHTLLDSSDTAAVKHILDFHLHSYFDTLSQMPQYHKLRSFLERGIAFHHSGVVPVLKEIVEVLFTKGYVKLLYATETFAVGINMPTKTVVFTGYRKYDDVTSGMRMLNTDEYIQMAGRAGRRGKDDKGLVLYLPDRDPEELDDVKKMMTGSKSTFQSRMTFHYDFLLKTLQSGNLDWIKLMRQSYWYRKHDLLVEGVRKSLAAEEKKLEELFIKPDEIVAMEERDELTRRLKDSVNAARKEAQKRWNAWENTHMGPRWVALAKEIWPMRLALQRSIETMKGELEAAAEPADAIWPSLHALKEMGFLCEPVADLQLSHLGTMATEVNEGHPILMAQTYQQGLLKNASPEVILTVLAGFIHEGSREMPPVDSLNVPTDVTSILWRIHEIGVANQGLEDKVGASRPPRDSYWELNTMWIEPVWRWLEGETTQQICIDYDCYEGNLIRLLMKIVNLLEEWRCLATLCEDIEMLEKMRGLETKVMRHLTISDSLYLRL